MLGQYKLTRTSTQMQSEYITYCLSTLANFLQYILLLARFGSSQPHQHSAMVQVFQNVGSNEALMYVSGLMRMATLKRQ